MFKLMFVFFAIVCLFLLTYFTLKTFGLTALKYAVIILGLCSAASWVMFFISQL